MILEIKDLQMSFRSVVGTTRAVNGVSFAVQPGEIVGLVGESGCGKSVTARSVVGLVPSPPAVFESGEIWLNTRAGRVNMLVNRGNERVLRRIRGREVSMIFQEPMRSLHPMMPVGSQVAEGILEHEEIGLNMAYARTEEMLEMVGLPQPSQLLSRYPHELSGGMRQRVMIALALACRPQLLIADEPTTALDVTIQAQILELIRHLRDQLGMSVLLITHNMGVVASIADRVSVMYLGVIVETGTVHEVFEQAAHPYTQGLLASIPSLHSEPKTPLQSLKGVVPELALAPQGCVFADRCPEVMSKCLETPPLITLSEQHKAKCWLYDSPAPAGAITLESPHSQTGEVVDERPPAPPTKALAGHAAVAAGGEEAVAKLLPDTGGSDQGGSTDDDDVGVRVREMTLHYPIYKGVLRRKVGTVQAVDDFDLTIHRGEIVGLVGESGCGKTSVGRLITRLVDPTAGSIQFRINGELEDITHMSEPAMKGVRRQMGMVFQDPLSSLNPRLNVRDIVGEPLILHKIAKGKEVDARVGRLLEMVGLRPEHQSRFPHAFSGGQRQRIAIARALSTEPAFLVADEPVSALDVSVQSQVLNLLMDLQQQLDLTMLFIAHDIAVVRHISDRIAVMYLGKIVEIGSTTAVCSTPVHPYTEALLASIPLPSPGAQTSHAIATGELPDPSAPPAGCRFHTRCPYRQDICTVEEPRLRPVAGRRGYWSACHFQEELTLSGVDRVD